MLEGLSQTQFDKILTSPIAWPDELGVASFAELIFADRGEADDDAPIFLGHVDVRPLRVSLRSLRHTVLALVAEFQARGLVPGDTVCLVRLPRTSETLAAVLYAALSAYGLRVLLPMYVEVDRFASWLAQTGARAVFWSRFEVVEVGEQDADKAHYRRLSALVGELGIPECCLHDDLAIPRLLAERHDASPSLDDPRVAACLDAASLDSECLILTTSGTEGAGKLVRYRQEAFLSSCLSWELAGLFEPDRLGGRGLLLLFGHSMGIRAFWNAIWTRQPLCMITPEWFFDHPGRVRALLLPMAPDHVTGGPAVFRGLLELGRVFPTIKDRCLRNLRCAVSSGAAYDAELARRVEVALDLPLHNAYGTTETLQVLTTLAPSTTPSRLHTLGAPLPGVRVGFLPAPDGHHHLHVSSPCCSAGYVGEADHGEWLDTGDLVDLTDDGLVFVGRIAHDFTKDSFGLKMPRSRLARNYANLGPPVIHLELYPLSEEPGLAALVFTDDESDDPAELDPGAGRRDGDQAARRERLKNRVKALLDDRHERLFLELEDFEFRHLTIARFACVVGDPPRSTKGTVRASQVEADHRTLIQLLTGVARKHSALVQLDRDKFSRSTYERVASPRLGAMMRLAGLDQRYLSGHGDRLTYRARRGPVEVVDFVGGFGGNLIGHRHPEVVAEVRRYAAGDQVFALDQGSHRAAAGELARRLALHVARRTGRGYVVRFGSTGAEAVEMALAHAVLERDERLRKLHRDLRRWYGDRAPGLVAEVIAANRERAATESIAVLTVAGCFHGHSLGARSLLSPRSRRRARLAGMSGLVAIPVPPTGEVDIDALVEGARSELETLVMRDGELVRQPLGWSRVAAAIAEPILGEGGVIEVSRATLRRLGGYDFPLIIDEIQAGLGRAGNFLASMGIDADYYLFGKALGGGVAKISALLVDRRRYVDEFDELYSSTFAADGFSSAIASRVLSILEEEGVSERARSRGKAIYMALAKVARDYPDVIAQVRGRGLLLGIELGLAAVQGSVILRTLAGREKLGSVAAAYLLRRHRVRILPTLSAPNTLRVEPSAFVDDAAIGQLVGGLRGLCAALRAGDLAELFGFLVEDEEGFADPMPLPDRLPNMSMAVEEPAPDAVRVGFLTHFVLPEHELAMIEPSLGRLSATGRRALFDRLIQILELRPFLGFGRNLFGGRVWFAAISVPADAATFEHLIRSGDRALEIERVQEAVELAAAHGCRAVALGGFTSIVTSDGTAIHPPPGVQVSSGNSFTVAAGLRRLRRACASAGLDWGGAETRLAVVGATGNIGAGIVRAVTRTRPAPGAVVLVGRNRDRLTALAAEVGAGDAQGQPPRVTVADDLTAVRSCDLVIIATSSNEPLLYPNHVAEGRPVVIADLSVPSAVSPLVGRMDNVLLTPFSGTVEVPGEPEFVISSHTAPGTTFCCAAEAMLLGLEPGDTEPLSLVGPVDPDAVELLDRLGVRHGFTERGGGGFRTGEVA